MPKKSFTKDEMEKYTHQYSYEIKLIEQYFSASVEQILSHILLSKVHYPDGQPMLQRISLATKALGTPEDRKETANQFITALCKQLFGKAYRQTDVRRTMNRYKFRFAKLPIISDYKVTKKGKRGAKKPAAILDPLAITEKKAGVTVKVEADPDSQSSGSLAGKEFPPEPGLDEKKAATQKELKDEQKIATTETEHPPEESEQKADFEFQPDSPKTVSAQEIKARDKMILRLAWGILDRNRPMLNESAIQGADFILGQLQLELIRQNTY